MMKSFTKFFALLGLLVVFGARAGDDDLDMDKLVDLSLDELMNLTVVSASKIAEKPSEAPSVIVLVTSQPFETYGWQSLNDVLYRQAGFGPGQDYDRQTVPTRGLFDSWSANHLLHLVDGIPMNDNLYGTAYTWDITPLFLARDLEIIRGPGSALYGSNATNGVVQVNTVSVKDLSKKVQFRAERGSLGSETYDTLIGHETAFVDMVVGFQSRETDGFQYRSADGSGRLDDNGLPQEFDVSNERSSTYLWTKLQFHGALDGLTAQYHEQEWSFETGLGWLWWVPDLRENMTEKRRIISLKYSPKSSGPFSQEYVLRHQRHDIEWLTRYYPDGAFGDYYPAGMFEYLDTDASDTFFRAQFGYDFAGGHFLLGLENDRFVYQGDKEHYSNVNVDSGDFEPFPDNRNTPLGPWLDFLVDHPVINTALFAQYSSGSLFNKFKLTAGVRYDKMDLDFDRIYEEGRPEANRTFSRVSPRLSLVYLPTDKVSLRLMGGKAFRAPTPTELAGAHTFSLGSNIEGLQPEILSTLEAAFGWRLHSNFNLRMNFFQTEFENQIAYSTQNNNLSTNIISQTNQGLETELIYRKGPWDGFLNVSTARLVDQTILDNTIADGDDLAWEPEIKINTGMGYTSKNLKAGMTGHYHGAVQRRDSEIGSQELPLGVGVVLDLDQSRSREVSSWISLDAHFAWQFTGAVEVGLNARNLLDKEDIALVKTGPFPFDYRQQGRTAQVYAKVSF